MAILDDIKTIVIVMLENRSFDNVLGHIRTVQYGDRRDIEGLSEPEHNPQYRNFLNGVAYAPVAQSDAGLLHDLPHGRELVATQMAVSGKTFTMSGFVEAYFRHTGSVVNAPPPMAFLTPEDVPVSNFFARQFLVCDHWFSPVPADTQPNRSIAFSGYTMIDNTTAQTIPVPDGSFIFDWLNARKVDWRVYHSGLSFFMLFERYLASHGSRFRNMRDFAADYLADPADAQPSVMFIEPEYTDSPVHPANVRPNDNHPPTPISHGEDFLREIYTTLSSNPEKFAQTMLIVTCDEHGGFFDHVPPPPIETRAPASARFTDPFTSLGPRVPAMIVTPRIGAGTVFKGTMDHTSILQLLAEKFDPGNDYNDEVKRRRLAGINSVATALSQAAGPLRSNIPAVPATALASAALTARAEAMPSELTPGAFVKAGERLLAQDRYLALKCFPELAYLLPQAAKPVATAGLARRSAAPMQLLQSKTVVIASVVHQRLMQDHHEFNGDTVMGDGYHYNGQTIRIFLGDVSARLKAHQPAFEFKFTTEFALAALAQNVMEMTGSIDEATT